MGQRKTVRVFQLIAENTIEAKVLEIREFAGVAPRADSQRRPRTLWLRM
jgi:hypothetical protein